MSVNTGNTTTQLQQHGRAGPNHVEIRARVLVRVLVCVCVCVHSLVYVRVRLHLTIGRVDA